MVILQCYSYVSQLLRCPIRHQHFISCKCIRTCLVYKMLAILIRLNAFNDKLIFNYHSGVWGTKGFVINFLIRQISTFVQFDESFTENQINKRITTYWEVSPQEFDESFTENEINKRITTYWEVSPQLTCGDTYPICSYSCQIWRPGAHFAKNFLPLDTYLTEFFFLL